MTDIVMKEDTKPDDS